MASKILLKVIVYSAAYQYNLKKIIEIADNGAGMDACAVKHIFDPFFTTKSAGSGTGLGLSISYYIVTNNHGGSISADSEPGKDSRFTIRLPVG